MIGCWQHHCEFSLSFDIIPDAVLRWQHSDKLHHVFSMLDVGLLLEPPFVHVEDKIFDNDFIDDILSGEMRIFKHNFSKSNHLFLLKQLVQVQEILKISELLFVNFFLNNLNLSQNLIGGTDKFFFVGHLHDCLLPNLLIEKGTDDVLLLFHDFKEGKINFNTFKSLSFFIDLLNGL